MARQRFVLRYRGEGPKPETDVARVRDLVDATVVDESSPRMLLVESAPGPLRDLVGDLADWVMAPEHHYPVPDARTRAERPPP